MEKSVATGKKKKLIILAAALIIVLAAFIIVYESFFAGAPAFNSFSEVKVLIDAGHGGSDGGTVGVHGSLEADINLKLALRLKGVLESAGASVQLTRADEKAVGATKNEDMANRAAIIGASDADIMISIHQNHYDDPSVSGPQVFYSPASEQGKLLAQSIQDSLIAILKPDKQRTAMPGDYLVLRSGKMPSVIVECGFLSNEKEEALLKKTQYQIMIVDAITQGLSSYLFGKEELFV